ncbi:MAG: replication protein [Acidobacteriota bacterium]|nr:replication protein [Acidobacteriota bacterium]
MMNSRREDSKRLIRAGDILEERFPFLTPQETPNILPPAKPTEFANIQLSLFQSVLCNTEEEKAHFSNAIDLWDSIPRYSVSRQAQAKARENGKFLDNHTAVFQHRDRTYTVTISPARVNDLDGSQRDYYPSTTEELIEEALRKLAIDQYAGFFDKPTFRSGVVFTIYQIREELKKHGHARSYQEIILALNILSKSVIEIRENTGTGELLAVSPYLPALVAVSRKRLKDDPTAKWAVQFHPFVTDGIDKVTYRQYNYALLMSHESKLTRWLHKYVVLKCTAADLVKPFSIHFVTIKRDSCLLNEYTRERAAIDAVQKAFDDLKQKGVLHRFDRRNVTGPRKKLVDVVFTIWPSFDFVKEVKAANKRQTDAAKKVSQVGLNGGLRQNPVGTSGKSR